MAEHKQYDRALAFCRQAALLEPNSSRPYAEALAYAELGKDSKAMAWAIGNIVYLDDNAAGFGWFVDPTPGDNAEFGAVSDHLFQPAPSSSWRRFGWGPGVFGAATSSCKDPSDGC